MTKRNSRHESTTKTPLDQRERQPHRSGQEYEYGETPQTGLGGGGTATDPSKQNARTDDREHVGADDPKADSRQGGGNAENSGFARGRDEKHPAPKGGRRAKFDHQNEHVNIRGEQGIPPHVEHDR